MQTSEIGGGNFRSLGVEVSLKRCLNETLLKQISFRATTNTIRHCCDISAILASWSTCYL